jgi:hypothetical protein
MIPFPEISPKFTIEDIRKIRDHMADEMENMTQDERIAYIRAGAEEVKKKMDALRATRDSKKASA